MDTPLDELQWKSPEWIQAFGLRTDNVLDYFAESPFFDKTANNHVIKMQRQFSQLPNNGAAAGSMNPETMRDAHSEDMGQEQEFSYVDPIRRAILEKYVVHAFLERALMQVRGIEYVLANVREPDFWVIKKQRRTSPTAIEPLQTYYIVGANVYQSPTVFKIVQSRLLACSSHLSATLAELNNLVEFKPSQGVQYKNILDMPVTTRKPGNTANVGSVPGTISASLNMPMVNTGRLNSAGAATIGTSGVPNSAGMTGANTMATGQTGATSRFENGSSRSSTDAISTDTLDKLLITSMKSTPEYI